MPRHATPATESEVIAHQQARRFAGRSLQERTAERQREAREALGRNWVGHRESTFKYQNYDARS